MKSHGRVYLVRPSSRPFTFALLMRPSSLAIGPIMNVELKQMQAARKETKG